MQRRSMQMTEHTKAPELNYYCRRATHTLHVPVHWHSGDEPDKWISGKKSEK